MEDKMKIQERRYKDFCNEITRTLEWYSTSGDQVTIINTGVTVSNDADNPNAVYDNMYSINCAGNTVAHFRVDKNNTIKSVTINPLVFSQPFYGITSIYRAKDKKIIVSYLESFVGTTLILEESETHV